LEEEMQDNSGNGLMIGEPTGAEEVSGPESVQAEASTVDTPLTLDSILKVLDERDKKRDQEIARLVQSQKDKIESSVIKKLREQGAHAQQVADVAQRNGLTKEQAATLQQALMNDALQAALKEEEAASAPAENGQGQGGPTIEQINAQAMQLATKYGLSENDPEVDTIKNDGTLEEYFESIREAGIMKRLRLKQTQSDPSRSPGAMPTGGRAPNYPDLKDVRADALYDRAMEQRRARR
jgi:hypothetical protein